MLLVLFGGLWRTSHTAGDRTHWLDHQCACYPHDFLAAETFWLESNQLAGGFTRERRPYGNHVRRPDDIQTDR